MKHGENKVAKLAVSWIVCTVVHLAFPFVVMLIIAVRKKPVSYTTLAVVAFFLPSIAAGWLLGRTTGIAKPVIVVPISAAIVWSAFALVVDRWHIGPDAFLAVACSTVACILSGMQSRWRYALQ